MPERERGGGRTAPFFPVRSFKMRHYRILRAVVLGLILAWPLTALGSGSYSHKLSRASSATNTAKYHRGKQIFTGQARYDNGSPAPIAQHEERLKELQALLPQEAQGSVNLPQLAGKINADHLEALEYYLSVRYRIEITP